MKNILESLFKRFGIDYDLMIKILKLKLLMDGRRANTFTNNQNKADDESKNKFIKSLSVYFIMGLFMILFVLFQENYLYGMSFIFGITIFLLMTSLIADFSSVILDVKDKEIILSKPVDSRTYNAAKVLHIARYILMISLAIAAPSLLVSLAKKGVLFFLVYLLQLLLISLFVIILTAMVYLFILRFFSGEKLKDIINYVQIGLTITMSVGYQLLGRVFNLTDGANIVHNPRLWKYFFPPLWFAAPFDLIFRGDRSSYIIIYSILGIVVPILSIIVYIKLIPSFERNLTKLNSADGQHKDRHRINHFWASLLCRSESERTFYKFSANMIKNERTFKLKVYPSLGMSLVFPFIMFINYTRGDMAGIESSKIYLWIYMTYLMIPTAIASLAYSGNHEGAWIFETIPIEDKGLIYRAAVKASTLNLFLPVFMAVSIIFLIIYHMSIWLDVLVILVNLLLFTAITYKVIKEDTLPFSNAFDPTKNPGSGAVAIGTMMIAGGFGLIHFLLTLVPYVMYIYLPVAIAVNIIFWNRLKWV